MSYIDDKNGVYKCGRKSLELNAFITAEISTKNSEINFLGQVENEILQTGFGLLLGV